MVPDRAKSIRVGRPALGQSEGSATAVLIGISLSSGTDQVST